MDQSEILRAIRSGLRPLEAVEPLRLSQWSARHFYLSAESSYVEGAWRAYPYQVAILDCMGNDAIREVNLQKSARVGYTKMLLAALGYFAEHRHRNQCVWQPTDDDSDEFCKTELEPMLRDVPAMERVFPRHVAKHKDNTLRQKKFLGCFLHLRGGKAAKNFRRLSIDVAYLDELDGFDPDIEKEGSPVMLSAKRVEGATFPKHVLGSTPKLKHLSLIEARVQHAHLRFQYHIPCPHCEHEHPLTWGGREAAHGMKWTGRDPESIAQLCPACGSLYRQSDYLRVWERGRWIADGAGHWIDPEGRLRSEEGATLPWPDHVAFWNLWTAYSPHVGWSHIARDFFAAVDKARKGEKFELKTFTNTTLGQTWEEEVEKTDASDLARRVEAFPLRIVPLGGLVLVAGVDVQDNRFECVVWALGRGEEMWTVDYTVLNANPADERDWDKLDAYLQTRFRHAAGGLLKIEGAGIDTGGHFTHQAYNFCRGRGHRRIMAIKGDHRPGQPVKGRASMQDVNWRGKILKRGVKLWHVGTDTAKDLLFGRLKVTQPGPGFVHFSNELPPEFFDQLTAEVRVPQRTSRGESFVWVRQRSRNEVLDCTVYGIFVSHVLDLHRYTDAMWGKLEAAVQPPVRDIFDQAEAPLPVPAEAEKTMQQVIAPPPVPRRGWVSKW